MHQGVGTANAVNTKTGRCEELQSYIDLMSNFRSRTNTSQSCTDRAGLGLFDQVMPITFQHAREKGKFTSDGSVMVWPPKFEPHCPPGAQNQLYFLYSQ